MIPAHNVDDSGGGEIFARCSRHLQIIAGVKKVSALVAAKREGRRNGGAVKKDRAHQHVCRRRGLTKDGKDGSSNWLRT